MALIEKLILHGRGPLSPEGDPLLPQHPHLPPPLPRRPAVEQPVAYLQVPLQNTNLHYNSGLPKTFSGSLDMLSGLHSHFQLKMAGKHCLLHNVFDCIQIKLFTIFQKSQDMS